MVFCRTNKSRSSITISCGNIGFDGAAPMLRKNEPVGFRIRRTCSVHPWHHRKYDCRSCRSEYLPYSIPRLYGGDVTTTSTLSSPRRDIPPMQSSWRSSNRVIEENLRIATRFVQQKPSRKS